MMNRWMELRGEQEGVGGRRARNRERRRGMNGGGGTTDYTRDPTLVTAGGGDWDDEGGLERASRAIGEGTG